MIINFGYGKEYQPVDIPDRNLSAVPVANRIDHTLCGQAAVEHALDNPIGKAVLENCVRKGMKIAVIASDISRPVPSREILPSVISRLNRAGVPDSDICIVFALGSHRCHTEEEKRSLAGEEIYSRIHCEDSNPDDCVSFGVTSAGTPVDITRRVAEADFVIATGNIEFHYFAGYSGGAKAIMPGVSTLAAIQSNHSLMVNEAACAGRLDGNPIRADIEEAGSIVGLDYIVNVVLDEHRKIVYAVAGDRITAHRAGCEYLDKMYRVSIPRRADIVLVSQGGSPKDVNLYQTQKALDNAKNAVRDGGTIILIGECPERMGSRVFEQWFNEASSPEELVERISRDFQLGGHKAASIAMVMQHADIELVSSFEPDYVRSLFMTPRKSAQEALDLALKRYGEDASVIAMPFGGATLPFSAN